MKAYLGLLNYYHRFLPNLSTWLAPLHNLLRKSIKWHWGSGQRKAFEKSKQLIQSPEVLVHYDTQKDLILACDASPYGVGAVLSHRMVDGKERPISFMSRTLTPSERNYSLLFLEISISTSICLIESSQFAQITNRCYPFSAKGKLFRKLFHHEFRGGQL